MKEALTYVYREIKICSEIRFWTKTGQTGTFLVYECVHMGRWIRLVFAGASGQARGVVRHKTLLGHRPLFIYIFFLSSLHLASSEKHGHGILRASVCVLHFY